MRYLLFCMVLFSATALSAAEFRAFKKIGTTGPRPDGATSVSVIQPVDYSVIEQGIHNVAKKWSNGNIQEVLSDTFYDRERLDDTIEEFIPRDAELRVLSIQNHRTIEQYEHEGALVSRVAVTVQTQIEFNDPANGFQRIPGTTEYILKITQGGGE